MKRGGGDEEETLDTTEGPSLTLGNCGAVEAMTKTKTTETGSLR